MMLHTDVRAVVGALPNAEFIEVTATDHSELPQSPEAIERLLYRLGLSRYGSRYVLDGAMLFRLWTPTRGRATWDLDLHTLAAAFAFDGPALAATFARRGTPLPVDTPLVLAPGFLADPARQTQWRAFLRRGRLDAPPDAETLASALRGFLGPVLEALSERRPFVAHWPAGGPWSGVGLPRTRRES